MRRWTWLAALALVGVLAAIPWAAPALANGPTNPQAPAPYGGWWEEMSDFCPGARAMTAGWGMGIGEMGLRHPVTLERVAGTVGLTYEELTARLARGETIAQVAQALGVDTSLVVTTILAPQSEVLQVRVKYGYLSEIQAQAILEQARLWVEQAIAVPLYSFYGSTYSPTPGYAPGYAPGYGGGAWDGPGGMMGRGMMGGGMMGR